MITRYWVIMNIYEYSEREKNMEEYCHACDDNHFLLSNDENGNDDLQKCDECNYFKSDDEAKQYVLKRYLRVACFTI